MRVLATALLLRLALAALPAANAAEESSPAAAIQVPAVHGAFGDVKIDVLVDDAANVGMAHAPHWVLFAAGAMAVPLSLAPPIYGLGLLYPVLGPPLNAAFDVKREEMVRVIAAEPLPAAVLAALRERLAGVRVAGPAELRLAIGGYGLAPRDGRSANLMFDIAEELCMTARARLTILRPGRAPVADTLRVEAGAPGDDALASICAPIGRFADPDGIALRQALGQLADALAALVVLRLEAQR